MMWRVLAILTFVLSASAAAAWEFVPDPICTLSHEARDVRVVVTHDPRIREPYAIALTRPGTPWPETARFAIRFDGPRGLTITTDRHSLTESKTKLTVTDTGFGNVLNGLEFNVSATASLGEDAVTISLDGAAGPVRAFRDCSRGNLARRAGPAHPDEMGARVAA